MDGVGGFAGWRWLYILSALSSLPRSPSPSLIVVTLSPHSEGLLSVLIASLMFFILPDNPSQAWFLSPEERELAGKRIARVKLYHGAGPLDWKEVRNAFKDWKLYVRSVCVSDKSGIECTDRK